MALQIALVEKEGAPLLDATCNEAACVYAADVFALGSVGPCRQTHLDARLLEVSYFLLASSPVGPVGERDAAQIALDLQEGLHHPGPRRARDRRRRRRRRRVNQRVDVHGRGRPGLESAALAQPEHQAVEHGRLLDLAEDRGKGRASRRHELFDARTTLGPHAVAARRELRFLHDLQTLQRSHCVVHGRVEGVVALRDASAEEPVTRRDGGGRRGCPARVHRRGRGGGAGEVARFGSGVCARANGVRRALTRHRRTDLFQTSNGYEEPAL